MNDIVGNARPVDVNATRRLAVAGALIVAVSVISKLWLASAYPTLPVSDFKRVVEFAAAIVSEGPAPHTWHWTMLNPGTSVLLAPLLALFGGDSASVARTSTAVAVGLLPLLPLVMLRYAVPAWVRVVAAAGLAALPAFWVFAPVVAQDNWVMLPVVGLACLAINNAYRAGGGAPIGAALLYSLAVYIRQEMLVAALPLAFVAMWPFGQPANRLRTVAIAVGVVLGLLTGMAAQRHAATGRFALTTDHGGASMLGSYVPGAGFGWKPYETYAASVDPVLAVDNEKLMARAGSLAWHEIARRPAFHLERRLGALWYAMTATDGTLTYWSLFDDAQMPEKRAAATSFATAVNPWVRYTLVLLHALFLGALFVGWRRRDPAVIAIGAFIALKCAIQFIFATQARFFLVVSALEVLAVALAALHVTRATTLKRPFAVVGAIALAVLSTATWALPRWEKRLAEPDVAAPSLFILQTAATVARCEVHGGKLLSSSASAFSFQTIHADPAPGEIAEVHCDLRARSEGATLRFEVGDRYAPGGFSDRMFQVVVVDGRVLRDHDIAAQAWSGWWPFDVPVANGQARRVTVRIRALRPDPGPAWGNAAATDVRVSDVPVGGNGR